MLENHPLVAVFAVCLFCGIKILFAHRKSSEKMAAAGGAALGVYIIHPVFLHILVRVADWNPQLVMPAISIPLTVAGIYVCSLVTVRLSSKIRVIKKYLF